MKSFGFKLKTEEKEAKYVGVSYFSRNDALACNICLSLLFKPSMGRTKAFPAFFM
jgi:hypothetical protein